MTARNSKAGGIFLMIAIIGGTVIGIVREQPMQGVLIGTGVGIAVALVAWLIDRRG